MLRNLATLLILSNFFYNINTTGINYTSQPNSQQDKYLNENFFYNKRNGVFVDIGAHDGISYSNSYFFEKALNWTGICIEPQLEEFTKLKNNRNCICLNACVSNQDGIVKFIKVPTLNPLANVYPEYNNNMLSGMLETFHPGHFARLQLMGIFSYDIIEVRALKLNNILKENNIYYIDYLSIDTEGGEIEILKSIDYDIYYIYTITVENNYADSEIRKFMESKNFKFLTHLGQDEVYINTNSLKRY